MITRTPLSLLLSAAIAFTAIGCGDDDDNNKPKPSNNNNNNNNDMGSDMDVVAASLSVEDQVVADTSVVTIASATADQASWIAVFSTKASGDADELLGHVAVAKGEASALTIELARDVKHDEVLRATMYLDDPADGAFVATGDAADAKAVDENQSTVTKTFKVQFNPSVVVEDQSPEPEALNKVLVKRVVSRGAGWMAIHAQQGTAIGPVLGYAPVANGDGNEALTIELTRPVVDGERLYAALHADSPADDMFTFDGANGEDDLALDDAMNTIAPSFTISVLTITPSVQVEDQTPAPLNEVVVKHAVSDGPGWIVIHENDSNGKPGAVLGQTALVEGDNDAIKVTLSRDVVNGELLYAMLHKDEGALGTYEFPGPDVPVTNAEGDVIAPAFTVLTVAEVVGIEVQDQEVDPINVVHIARVTALAPGFLVIYEPTMDANKVNQFGRIIGSTPISSGIQSDVTVMLSRDARDGETLSAVLHVDLGNAGVFEYPGPDDFALDMMSQPVAKDFKTQVTNTNVSSVSVMNQDANPLNRVVVQQIIHDAAGWIVIHEDNAGAPGAVIGKTLLTAGVSQNVAITLSRDVVDGEVLYAMLHKDEGVAGTYEFPGADAPVLDPLGAVIAPAFTIIIAANNVFAVDQSPTDVSTIMEIDSIYSRQAGIVAIYTTVTGPPDAGGIPTVVPDELLGYELVPAGLTRGLQVVLKRPAVLSERLITRLHVDAPADNAFTFDGVNGDDPIALDASGVPALSNPFYTLIGSEVPAVRFTVNTVGASAYQWVSAHPARFAAEISSTSMDNPTITLRRGWRYSVTNNSAAGHPLELISRGATRALDTVLMSQSVEGSLEMESSINWVESGDEVGFTVSPEAEPLLTPLNGYRCAVSGHATMRGAIVIAD
jgi:hypothetical protein